VEEVVKYKDTYTLGQLQTFYESAYDAFQEKANGLEEDVRIEEYEKDEDTTPY
jgi:hypothetical protein